MIRKIGFVVALVLMLSSGFAQEKDDLDSIREAAQQGYAIVQTHLGFMYYTGKGVAQDYQEAAKWFRKAAEQGDADAIAEAFTAVSWIFAGAGEIVRTQQKTLLN